MKESFQPLRRIIKFMDVFFMTPLKTFYFMDDVLKSDVSIRKQVHCDSKDAKYHETENYRQLWECFIFWMTSYNKFLKFQAAVGRIPQESDARWQEIISLRSLVVNNLQSMKTDALELINYHDHELSQSQSSLHVSTNAETLIKSLNQDRVNFEIDWKNVVKKFVENI
jgi:hypothetical protein